MQEDSLFPVGRVAGPDDVVDREPFIDLIVHELISGQSVMIAGPRRIGKTSVAYEILRRLEQKGCSHGGHGPVLHQLDGGIRNQVVCENRRASLGTFPGSRENVERLSGCPSEHNGASPRR